MKIPFFNYPGIFEQRREEYLSVLEDVMTRGAFIMQKDLDEFEENLAKMLDVDHAIGVADGTMALILSLKASELNSGDEVIVSAHTFIASAAAINHVGAIPVLADIGEDHLIDPNSIKRLISKKTKAIMPVQLNGRISKMDEINQIAQEFDLKIIEDSCQALGATYKGKFAGTFGTAGSFSFFPAKTLGCFGDGGAVVTNSSAIAKKIKMLRDHGRDLEDGKVKFYGYNARLDNIQAAVLNLKLRYYEDEISRRREIASMYDSLLSNLSELVLPPPPKENSSHYDVYQNYEIQAHSRDELKLYLEKNGVGTIIQWGGYSLNNFDDIGLKKNLKNTDLLFSKFLMLPMHSMLKNEEVEYISRYVKKFYEL